VARLAATPSTLGVSFLGIGLGNAHLRRMKRPRHLDPPPTLSKSPPVPQPEDVSETKPPAGEEGKLDPTRYGDWERKGIAVDF
jgi:hypothetical protein